MSRQRLIVMLLASGVLFGLFDWDDTLADDNLAKRLAQVDALFADCNKPEVPGCAVGIISRGELIYQKGFGSANLIYEVPNTPQTLFELASASKAFTSACLAILMDQGKVSPDDDVRKFIPELQPHTPPVRIRDMLRCESGIWAQFHIMPLAGWNNVPLQASYSKADLLDLLAGQKQLPFEPGTDYQYSSSDFFLLGIVVERVTGQTLAQFAKANLFDPLGMRQTFFEEDAGLVVKNRAVGHWKSDEGWSSQNRTAKAPWRQWTLAASAPGGGGVQTTIEDLFQWDQAFEQGKFPRGKHMDEFREHGMVLENRFNLDADAHRKHLQKEAMNEPQGQHRGLKRMQFTGGFWGLTVCFSRYPQEHFAVICLSNSSDVSAFAKTREIAELFLGERMTPLPKPVPDENAIELDAETLKTRTGAFRGKGNSPVWRTELQDGRLMLVDHLDKAYELLPLSPTRFKPAEGSPFYKSARFEFTLDEACGFQKVTLSSLENGFHEVIPFGRVELVTPKAGELNEFAGLYHSEELGATYRFQMEEEALWLRVGSRRWERLRPLEKDEFTPDARDAHDQRFIRFTRNTEGKVTGFSIGLWRVRGVAFSKLPS